MKKLFTSLSLLTLCLGSAGCQTEKPIDTSKYDTNPPVLNEQAATPDRLNQGSISGSTSEEQIVEKRGTRHNPSRRKNSPGVTSPTTSPSDAGTGADQK